MIVRRLTRWLLLLAALACGPFVVFHACGILQPGVRLLHVDYRVEGELVLRTYYGDPDARRADDVWDYLSRRPMMVEEETCTVVPSAEDPLRAVLEGAVTVEVLHVERSLRRTEVPRLVLVRDSTDKLRWHLTKAERDRTRPR